ncbi:shikimate dehydrogenase [Leucobacter tenebrionis]|nr:shikimate dehydrogenase [Leucobacter tenebrionis]
MRDRRPEPPSRLFGLLGTHIEGSLSPLMHEAEAARQRLMLSYRLLDTALMGLDDPDWEGLIHWARRFTFTGLNITHPGKQAVIPALDELDDDATLLGAVNTVVFDGGRAIGRNTDHVGFSEALDALHRSGAAVGMDRVVQLGAGGAGAAIAYSLLRAGAKRISLVDVDPERGRALADRLGRAFDRARMEVLSPDEAPAALRVAQGLVNCTPIGMTGVSEGSPIPLDALHPGLWVGDVIYRPLETTLVRAARELGCPVFGGAQMVVGQAAASFGIFTGRRADRTAMLHDFEAEARLRWG